MILAALASLAVAPVQDEDAGSLMPDCGTAMPATKKLLRAIPNDHFTGAGSASGGAVLVGDVDSMHHGTVAFVRHGGRWRGWAILSSASSVAVYRAPKSGDVFVWAMIDVEGAGPGWTQIMIPADGTRTRCTTIRWPAALNAPNYESEYLGFDAFTLDARGRGNLTGTAAIERAGKPQRWSYRYTTRNNGRSWSAPQRVTSVATAPGLYRRAGKASAALIASLRKQVR